MLNLGVLAFADPWMLLALAGLPALWWLLRLTPPTPRRVPFPPIRILLALRRNEETPARTPPWLLILRLLVAASIVLALARPLLNPGTGLVGEGPVALVVDDGWAAGPAWQRRLDALARLVDQAERQDRPVVLLPTAPPATDAPMTARLLAAGEARAQAAALRPKPWPVDRRAALAALESLGLDGPTETVWLADSIADGGAPALARRLLATGPVRMIADRPAERSHLLLPPIADREGLRLTVLRSSDRGRAGLWVRAIADNGAVLGRRPIEFAPGSTAAEARLGLPLELRNRVARLGIEGEAGAGAAVLFDERWRRRPVGIVSGDAIEPAQPLLSSGHYLGRALSPFSEVRAGTVDELLRRELAVVVLADVGQVVGGQRQTLTSWLESGGVLVRFAGPRLAEQTDDLVPVQLRTGGRALGGALSWARPARLAPFAETSPFAGLAIPGDVLVRRQVLAEPALDLAGKTWARLTDGTPLVTAERRGEGWLVLFHITADPSWTNLPLSGLFVEILRRIVALSRGVAGAEGEAPLPPLTTLDGFGVAGEPGRAARAVTAAEIDSVAVGPRHPPGFYGTAAARRALNLGARIARLEPFSGLPDAVALTEFGPSRETDLKPWLLLAAVLLALADLAATLALRGLLRPGLAGAALAGSVAVLPPPSDALAQAPSKDEFALAATLDTRLAYVRTGLREVDEMSRAGLVGLGEMLARRTSVEPAPPIGIDIERDEILFFPLLYWPMTPEQPALSGDALVRTDRYMKNGGTILFDTRDHVGVGTAAAQPAGGAERLRRLLRRLDVPPLVPVPQDHVLTKAFYLMQDFPGRWAGGTVWVEGHGGDGNDGVSPLIIGANDWAAAWAVDGAGQPIAAVVPGGERQREMAFRFGVNLVMYALTGNYKADQVHVPALLERLGQ